MDDDKTESPKVETTEANGPETTAEGKTPKKEGDQVGEIEDTKQIPEETPPSEIQYTLERASEELYKFLFKLPTKNDDENNKASPEIPETVIVEFLDHFEEQLTWHDSAIEGKGKGSHVLEDDTLLLQVVDRVSKLAASIGELKSDADKKQCVLTNRIGAIKHSVMCLLEDEFRSILEYVLDPSYPKTKTKDAKGKQEEPESAESAPAEDNDSTNYSGYTPEMLSSLTKIAGEMISGGYESECVEIFMISRRIAFEDNLNHIGFQKFSIDDAHKMSWENLEGEITTWISTFLECATVYFPCEKKLADVVFTDYPMISSSVFSNFTRGAMLQFLYFAEAVAITKQSSEKLFKILDMYEALRDKTAALENLYPREWLNEIKTETATARTRLGEAAIGVFCDLENSIKSDTGKTPVPGGAVHPLTSYTMNYLKYACEYKNTLEQIFREHGKIERSDSSIRTDFEASEVDQNLRNNNNSNSNSNNNEENNPSPFSNQLVRVMDMLDANLEGRSKLYNNVPLSSIFMMNNGRYILQKIKGSTEMHEAMGNTWCRKKSSDLRNYHKIYQRETWGRLLGCLRLEGLMIKGKVAKPVLKERFKNFNAMFEEIHRIQTSWVVKDEQLQSELRVSISALVIPAYRSFVGRFSQYLDPGRQTEKYIKFQPEDIENYIDELFDGGKKKP
ncbi:exocyst complex component EXO70B1-like [Mangifera indica]|uniref:exocyst complex component EXO70B1-like n=1 Tax=Mangifera indica TaxID=29780 RepID=UPI001CFB1A27|nr:exocyst complex component EXO70B1-like [Mangifera indica]